MSPRSSRARASSSPPHPPSRVQQWLRSSRSRSLQVRRRSRRMGGQQRVYRQKIRSTQSLKKIFRAMELIAASRIGKARANVTAATPYSRALTRAVSAVATHSHVTHPLVTERTDTKRVAVLVVTSDRGMAGAYSASAIREAERLIGRLTEQGFEPVV